jgi:membrane-associated protease RseP (regulator of RpoE activity)
VTHLAVTQYFTHWRSVSLGSREVIEGLVSDAHDGPSPPLSRLLSQWDGHFYWEELPEGRWLVLVRESAPSRERWWLHAALLVATVIATSWAGAGLLGFGEVWWGRPTLPGFRAGLMFSLPLLAILLAHESGHYVTARRYRVDASPPFFIPFPPQFSLLGTLGAFIRLRSPVFDRRTLFDIGVAGPLAGIAVALPVLAVGLSISEHMPPHTLAMTFSHQFIEAGGARWYLGDSLLLVAMRAVLAPHGVLHLHPLATAGWVGVLVTMLNMLPLAQLDGGHIAFALFGRRQTWIARLFWVVLIVLGWRYWSGWWLWAALGLIFGRGRLAHPRIIASEHPLRGARRMIGYLTIVLFLATFMPMPISPAGY